MRQNHFIWLTLALVATFLAGALTEEFPNVFALNIIEFANVTFLLIALLSLREEGSWLRGLLFLITCMLILLVVRTWYSSPYLGLAYLLFLLVFYTVAIWLVGRKALLTGKVDFNIMIGSIALYFMLGLFFSVLYSILLQFSPEALKGIGNSPPIHLLSKTNYFSFVTLTTLGYGDITPATPMARTLVILESVIGMFYLAMIVASLVGAMRNKD